LKVVVGYHGHCFDGMASAALLTRFLRERLPGAEFRYRGLDHQPGGSFVPEPWLEGEVNAVVDFRYSMSEKLTWFFDHHITGLVGNEERSHFDSDTTGQKFYEPTYGSCCKLISDRLREKFGFAAPELDVLVHWAHIIDTASFESPKQATDFTDPVMQWMVVIEAHGDEHFLGPAIAKLSQGVSLGDLVNEPPAKKLVDGVLRKHAEGRKLIDERARYEDGVIFFDLSNGSHERYSKFYPYALFPEARYCVAVSAGDKRIKVSVGSNPWAKVPRNRDISAICARYGGGGHAAVGAVSFGPQELDKAREAASEIVRDLRTHHV